MLHHLACQILTHQSVEKIGNRQGINATYQEFNLSSRQATITNLQTLFKSTMMKCFLGETKCHQRIWNIPLQLIAYRERRKGGKCPCQKTCANRPDKQKGIYRQKEDYGSISYFQISILMSFLYIQLILVSTVVSHCLFRSLQALH